MVKDWVAPCKESHLGSKSQDGYYKFAGSTTILGENKVTRYIYKKYIGELAYNEEIRHRCHNPGCIEVTHLMKGTHKDNIHDQIRRGTYNRQKLTIEQVKEIRTLNRRSPMTMQEIGYKFGISIAQVSRIINRERWTNVY